MICNIKEIRKGGNYRCMTEIRELEVTIKHNLLTGKSALLFASFLQREAFLVFFLFRTLETTKSSHRANYFGVMVYLLRMR